VGGVLKRGNLDSNFRWSSYAGGEDQLLQSGLYGGDQTEEKNKCPTKFSKLGARWIQWYILIVSWGRDDCLE